MSSDYGTYIFAFFVLAGGVFGYLKTGSVMSLVAGIIFGLLLGYGAGQTSRNPKNITITLFACLSLAVLMGLRFYMSRKFFPAGITCLMSIVQAARHVYRYAQ